MPQPSIMIRQIGACLIVAIFLLSYTNVLLIK